MRIVDNLLTYMENKRLEIKNKRWRNGVHSCVCHVCRQVLDSRRDKWCPEECGWRKLKGNIYYPWICHQCLEHHNDNWVKIEQQ